MDISRILQDLLIKKETIFVPALGTLSLKYIPAEVFRISNRIAPPSYQLIFNNEPDSTDNSLTETISRVYNLTLEEAHEALNKLISEAIDEMIKGIPFIIKEIGSFKKEGGKIIFEADKNIPFLTDNYGLETIIMPLLEIEVPTIPKTIYHPEINVEKKSRKWILVSVIIILLITLGVAGYQYGYFQKGTGYMVSLFSGKSKPEIPQLATNDTLSGKIDAKKLKQESLKYTEDKKSTELKTFVNKVQTSREKKVLKYYLIAGSFKTKYKAQNLQDILITKGFKPEILNYSDTLYRVSIASYINRRTAVNEYIRLTSGENNYNLWLFSQPISIQE